MYRSNKEVYRNSAVPYLSKWVNKVNNGYRKNMDKVPIATEAIEGKRKVRKGIVDVFMDHIHLCLKLAFL